MKIWSASATRRYYLDPPIKFLASGNGSGGASKVKGYYIIPHCDPDCCRAFGGLTNRSLGPFRSRAKARTWSRNNLVET